jgi:two-component system response regulator CpxR
MSLLIVDDDAELCSLLKEFLEREGFTVQCIHEGHAALEALQQKEAAQRGGFDLIVLDVMLPGLDGFEILKRLRLTSRVPVLMLTARGEDVDRIVGLELGADDYLPKPFNPRELVARVKAILRRTEARVNRGKVEVNGVALDPGTREVTCDGKPVEVTTLEFDILEQLMRNAGRVVSRDGLMESLYNRKATPFDRSIDMHVSHLRRKLESSRPVIKTIRGVGYQFVSGAEEAPVGQAGAGQA